MGKKIQGTFSAPVFALLLHSLRVTLVPQFWKRSSEHETQREKKETCTASYSPTYYHIYALTILMYMIFKDISMKHIYHLVLPWSVIHFFVPL